MDHPDSESSRSWVVLAVVATCLSAAIVVTGVGGGEEAAGTPVPQPPTTAVRTPTPGLPPQVLAVPDPGPSGSWIAFSATRTDGEDGVYLIAPDGSGLQRIRGAVGRLDRAWSSDGRGIVLCDYTAIGPGSPASGCLQHHGLSKFHVHYSDSATFYDTTPVISPDGHRFACVRVHDASDHSAALVVHDLRTGDTSVVADFHQNVGLEVDWAPDGRSLVYSAAPQGGARDLWLVTIENKARSRLTELAAGESASMPTFGPDGDLVAFRLDGAAGTGLMVVRTDGTGPRSLSVFRHLVPRSLDWGPAVERAG